jgi:hypothetical protein
VAQTCSARQFGPPRFRRGLENQPRAAVAPAGRRPQRASLRLRHPQPGAGFQGRLAPCRTGLAGPAGRKPLESCTISSSSCCATTRIPSIKTETAWPARHGVGPALQQQQPGPPLRHRLRPRLRHRPAGRRTGQAGLEKASRTCRPSPWPCWNNARLPRLGLPTLLKLLGAPPAPRSPKPSLQQGFQTGRHQRRTVRRSGVAPAGLEPVSRAYKWISSASTPPSALRRMRCSNFIGTPRSPCPPPITVRCWTIRGVPPFARQRALKALADYPGREIGAEWLQKALLDPQLSEAVANWLRQGKLARRGFGCRMAERAWPCVRRCDRWPCNCWAIRNWSTPSRIGLPWLLAMARQADPTLHDFAHRYLLAIVPARRLSPAASAAGSITCGNWPAGPTQPEPVRHFAAAYLKAHHPNSARAIRKPAL